MSLILGDGCWLKTAWPLLEVKRLEHRPGRPDYFKTTMARQSGLSVTTRCWPPGSTTSLSNSQRTCRTVSWNGSNLLCSLPEREAGNRVRIDRLLRLMFWLGH